MGTRHARPKRGLRVAPFPAAPPLTVTPRGGHPGGVGTKGVALRSAQIVQPASGRLNQGQLATRPQKAAEWPESPSPHHPYPTPLFLASSRLLRASWRHLLPPGKGGARRDMSSEPRGVDQRRTPDRVKGRVARASGPLPLTRSGGWRRPHERGFVDMSLVSAGVNAPWGAEGRQPLGGSIRFAPLGAAIALSCPDHPRCSQVSADSYREPIGSY